MSLLEWSKLPGVRDLNINVRGLFAKALIHEDNGDHYSAKEMLDRAVRKETEMAGSIWPTP